MEIIVKAEWQSPAGRHARREEIQLPGGVEGVAVFQGDIWVWSVVVNESYGDYFVDGGSAESSEEAKAAAEAVIRGLFEKEN